MLWVVVVGSGMCDGYWLWRVVCVVGIGCGEWCVLWVMVVKSCVCDGYWF